jgi:hypothetical protein
MMTKQISKQHPQTLSEQPFYGINSNSIYNSFIAVPYNFPDHMKMKHRYVRSSNSSSVDDGDDNQSQNSKANETTIIVASSEIISPYFNSITAANGNGNSVKRTKNPLAGNQLCNYAVKEYYLAQLVMSPNDDDSVSNEAQLEYGKKYLHIYDAPESKSSAYSGVYELVSCFGVNGGHIRRDSGRVLMVCLYDPFSLCVKGCGCPSEQNRKLLDQDYDETQEQEEEEQQHKKKDKNELPKTGKKNSSEERKCFTPKRLRSFIGDAGSDRCVVVL